MSGQRNLITQTVKQFKGLNIFTSIVNVGPEFALDLLNCIVSGSGGLEKMRSPVALSPVIAGQVVGPGTFFDFQQASNPLDGTSTRQIIAIFGTKIYYFDVNFQNPTLIDTDDRNLGDWSIVDANNIAFMANGRRMRKWTGANFWEWQSPAPLTPPILGVATAAPVGVTGLTFIIGGRVYGRAFRNTQTGDLTTVSAQSTRTGNLANQLQPLTMDAPPDAQYDNMVLYASLDGGGDLFFHSEGPVADYLAYTDNKPDAQLDKELRAQLINDPPPLGRYLATFQGRIFIAGLPDAPTDIAYSGYERIFDGRPETSFPPQNRLRLNIGADEIRGIGVIQAGVVAFSKSNEMYMFRGIPEDVTVTAPLLFSAFLEQLPWSQGCLSHFTIAATPFGLVWWASDRTVQIFNGANKPLCLSDSINPMLRQATLGKEIIAKGIYWNYAERDWYILAYAHAGSGIINRIIFFDLDDDPETNAGIFISDIQCDSLGIVENAQGGRSLVISSGGRLYRFIAVANTQSGISQVVSKTNTPLKAYYRGGYFGNESSGTMKQMRYGKLLTDQGGFRLNARVVDDRVNTFANPKVIPINKVESGKLVSVNWKGTRLSWEIMFPDDDVDANVLELSNSYIPTSDR